jgi:hypothetical protein
LPNKSGADDASVTKPSKYVILLLAPTSVAGKVQIATSVAKSLSCPLFQGDSLHESSAKAAAVGASRSEDGGRGRYQRMWLNKMTRTGLLFPEESRPANGEFYGFGGESLSTPTSRRNSGSSISSTTSFGGVSATGSTSSSAIDGGVFGAGQFINKPVFAISEEERLQRSNPALLVLTHPELTAWHQNAIRTAVKEYGIGIIFVPLFKTEDESKDESEKNLKDEVPVLRPLDPTMIRGFTSFDALRAAVGGVDGREELEYGKGKEGNLEEEMVLKINVEGGVEDIIEEVVTGVTDVMFA